MPGQFGEEPLLEELVGCGLILHYVLLVGLHCLVVLLCNMLFCELVRRLDGGPGLACKSAQPTQGSLSHRTHDDVP